MEGVEPEREKERRQERGMRRRSRERREGAEERGEKEGRRGRDGLSVGRRKGVGRAGSVWCISVWTYVLIFYFVRILELEYVLVF